MPIQAPTQGPSMYCRGCGYDLRHSPSKRCPECGLEFHPSAPWTFLSSPSNPSKNLLLLALLGVFMILVSLVFARELGRTARPGHWNGFGTAYIALLAGSFLTEVVTACLSAVRFFMRFSDPRVRYGRHTLYWACAISFLVGVIMPMTLMILAAAGLLPRD